MQDLSARMQLLINNDLEKYGDSSLSLPDPPHFLVLYYLHHHNRLTEFQRVFKSLQEHPLLADKLQTIFQPIPDLADSATQNLGLVTNFTIKSQVNVEELTTRALNEALELNLLDCALDLIKHAKPRVATEMVVQVLNKEAWPLLHLILELKLTLSRGLERQRPLQLMRDLRLLNEDTDLGLTLAKVTELGLQYNVSAAKLLNALMACKDLNQTDALAVLLKHNKHKEARTLLALHYPVDDSSLVAALKVRDFKFAFKYSYKQGYSLQSHVEEVVELLSSGLSQDWTHHEVYLLFLRKLQKHVSYNHARNVIDTLQTLTLNRQRLIEFVGQFVNPVKMLVLYMELAQVLSDCFCSSLRPKCETVMHKLGEVASTLQKDLHREGEVQLVFFDKDIEGRTVISILIDIGEAKLVQGHNLAILANSVWHGNYIVNNSDVITATSSLWELLSLKTLVTSDLERGLRFESFGHNKPPRDVLHPFKYSVWRKAASFRYMLLFLEYFVVFVWPVCAALVARENIRQGLAMLTRGLKSRQDVNQVNQYLHAAMRGLLDIYFIFFIVLLTTVRYPLQYLHAKLQGRHYQIINGDAMMSLAIAILTILLFVLCWDHLSFYSVEETPGLATTTHVIQLIMQPSNFNVLSGILIFLNAIRCIYALKVNAILGPFIKMIPEMMQKILGFAIFFSALLLTFGFAGSIILPWTIPDVEFFDRFLLSLFQTTGGIFDLSPGYYNLDSIIFYIVFIVVFNILLLNLVVAILNSVYNKVMENSEALYRQEMIALRDMYQSNDQLQFLIWTFFGVDIITSAFGLLGYFFLSRKCMARVNTALLYFQYTLSILVVFPIYLAVEACLIPFVYLKVLVMKLGYCVCGQEVWWHRVVALLFFVVLGVPLLLIYLVYDVLYFVKNCYSEQHSLWHGERKSHVVARSIYRAIVAELATHEGEVEVSSVLKTVGKICDIQPELIPMQIGRNLAGFDQSQGIDRERLRYYTIFASYVRGWSLAEATGKTTIPAKQAAGLLRSHAAHGKYRRFIKLLNTGDNQGATHQIYALGTSNRVESNSCRRLVGRACLTCFGKDISVHLLGFYNYKRHLAVLGLDAVSESQPSSKDQDTTSLHRRVGTLEREKEELTRSLAKVAQGITEIPFPPFRTNFHTQS